MGMAEKVKCPQCGAENDATDINCTSCGTSLTTEPPRAPIPQPPTPAPPETDLPSAVPPIDAQPRPGQPTEAEPKMDEATAEKLRDQVVQRMREGADNQTITDELIKGGMDKDAAAQLVSAIDAQVAEAAAQEEYGFGSIMGGIVGGVIAAIIGGVVWGFIVVKTEREIGYVAWGIGLLCGFAVVLLAGRKKGLPFQLIAVLASLLGILIGKYATFYMLLMQELAKEAEEAGQAVPDVSVFEPAAIATFFVALPDLLSGFDILWVILAVVSAWSIPRGLGVKRPGHAAPPPRIG